MNSRNYKESSTNKKFEKAANFVKKLHESGVPIEKIDKNDWENVPSPGVYIGERKYIRFSNRDLQNALNHHNALNKKQFGKKKVSN